MMSNATLYLTASSTLSGALGIFHAYGDEELLQRWLDGRIGSKNVGSVGNPLVKHELRYGWLHDADGKIIDEVMLACPVPGMRVLMTHGGRIVRATVEGYFATSGFTRIDVDQAAGLRKDRIIDVLLANCLTEGQVSALLEVRQRGGEGWTIHPDVLMTHRVVLTGAPNAGKSSLMNMLSGYRRAFVHAEAGATRDVVDELVDLAGYAVLLGDLPGFSSADIGLAKEAWLRARRSLELAEAVWFVCDGSAAWDGETARAAQAVAVALSERETACSVAVVVNKADLPEGFTGEPWREYFPAAEAVRVCSLPGGDARGRLESLAAGMWKIYQ